MMLFRNRFWLAAAAVAIGLLQAWDSGVLRAAPWVQLVIATAVVVPPVVWGARMPFGVQALSVVLAFVLLTVARMAATVPLPTLHLAAFAPALLVFVLRGLEPRASGVEG